MSALRRPLLLRSSWPLPAVDEEHLLAIVRIFTDSRPSSSPALDSIIQPLLLRLTHPSSLLRALSLLPSPSSAPLLFLSAIRLCSPLADHRAAGKTLNLLLRSRNLRPAVDFLLSLPHPSPILHDAHFNALIRSLARAGHLRRALELFRLMPARGVAYSAFSFNSLLAALLHRGRTRASVHYFDLMIRLGVAPDLVTFNTLIRGFCLNAMLPEAFNVFHSMHRHRCAPDVVTYNILLDGLIRAGDADAARKLFDEMQKRSSEVVPNVVSYTTLMRGCCSRFMVDEAVALLGKMVDVGLKPNKMTYNTLMKGFCEAGKLDLMKSILDKNVGFKPDICTFNTLMAAHCDAGNVEDALKLFDGLTELGMRADSATYSTVIRGLCSTGKFERAEMLVDELHKKEVFRRADSCRPLMAAYNPLFEHLCSCGKTDKAGKVIGQLLERRATVDIASFRTVILGYCREGAFVKGFKLLVSMVMRDLKPDYELCEELVKGFISKGKIGFAWEALKRMLHSGHRPSTNCFHSVLAGLLKKDGYANEAADLVSVMLERKIRQSSDLSTDVIQKLFRNGLNKKAFMIIGLLNGNGYCVKMAKLVFVLCQEKKFLEARGLLLFGLEKKENLDLQCICMVVNGLCEIERASEAFDLFYNVVDEYGSSGISSCMDFLMLTLEGAGMLKEAEFVSKQFMKTNVGEKPNIS
ncbi:pentatricopeptide repeat-containing protein At1g02060, chloroplastic-like [Phalaenopsis equestris]|uniref:pentatricopeptide repeat-containing protein At1g02060, chloroplastic-like n=1 Tax=Phalaenopsis equestris TaxID=78828 RepID=UPI0009E620B2|nr:pentatricopeptide repeat-containing protein At1g02060, chloroplastic-like [Phalaenopsis equestris]